MDKIYFHQVGMEGGRIQMCMDSGPGPSKMPDRAISKYSENSRIAPLSQSSEIAWKMKAINMTECQRTDYSEMDVSIAGAKIKSENLRLKNIPEPQADESMECEHDLDIDKKLATKKVVPPTETKDETVPDESFNVLHKTRSQKRTIAQAVCEPHASYTLSPNILKITEDVIQMINKDTSTNCEVCLNYNLQKFSNIRNLKGVPDTEVPGGSFGVVMKVQDTHTGNTLISKQVKKNAQGKFYIEKNEVEVPLQFADVDNIAKFFGLYWCKDKVLFIMEDAGISLRQLISDPKFCSLLLEPGRLEKIMLDIFTAIYHLASHHVTHCDIKPENICLDMIRWVAKLVDFGSCKTPQNDMDYKGTTPEYLDPVANKFMHETYVMKNKNYPVHRLDDKDDVFAAGLVGLFLLKKVHPMIHFFTGCDTVVNMKTRLDIMKKISELTEQQMSQLLDIEMSPIMRSLLQGVLVLDRFKRWTACEAVCFLREKLGIDVQPPSKLCRQEPQPSNTQAEDMQQFISLHMKDKVVPQRIQKCEPPSSPDVVQNQGLGIMMKGTAPSTQTGDILLPAKWTFQQAVVPPQPQLNAQSQQWGRTRHPAASDRLLLPEQLPVQQPMMSPVLELNAQPEQRRRTRHPAASDRLLLPEQLNAQPEQRERIRHPAGSAGMLSDQERTDYNDLVKSFNTKTQMGQGCLPARQAGCSADVQQHDLQKFRMLPVSAGISQKMLFPNQRADQPLFANLGPVQEGQLAAGPMLGLSGGRVFEVAERFTSGDHGNIPNIEELMQPSEEPYRPKLKGRRCQGSQDEK